MRKLNQPNPAKTRGLPFQLCPRRGADFGVAEVNGRIYAIGGFDGNSPLNVNEAIQPNIKSWTSMSPMPTARSGLRHRSLQRQNLLHRRNSRGALGATSMLETTKSTTQPRILGKPRLPCLRPERTSSASVWMAKSTLLAVWRIQARARFTSKQT